MKNKINTCVLAIIVVVMFGAFRAVQSSTLIGSWKVESFNASYPDTMSAKNKTAAEADMKNLATRLRKSTFVFSDNGSLSYMGRKGKWAMRSDGKTVDFISDKNEKSLVTIVKLSHDNLMFTRLDDGITQTFQLTRFIKSVK